MSSNNKLKSTIESPLLPNHLPQQSQWLAGEGAGSWFNIISGNNGLFEISRYNPEGKMECSGKFQITNNTYFDLRKNFEFIHLSHCKSVTIRQENSVVKLEKITNP